VSTVVQIRAETEWRSLSKLYSACLLKLTWQQLFTSFQHPLKDFPSGGVYVPGSAT
jgi:hypothetical protein